MVAPEGITSFVDCESRVTAFAIRDPAAVMTDQRGSKSSSVKKHQNLITLIKVVPNHASQRVRESTIKSAVLYVHEIENRRGRRSSPLRES